MQNSYSLSVALEESLLERFLRYVVIDTQSNPASETFPSTDGQLKLLGSLETELKDLGLADVILLQGGYLRARIPATTSRKVPVIAFFAHVDTAFDFSGAHVKPLVHRNYQGEVIPFPDAPALALDPEETPELKNKRGDTVITTSGRTLLGADDKAGVAELVTFAEYCMSHSGFEHGEIELWFTPDEEIGKGVERFDLKDTRAIAAYTLDGGGLGEVVCETFSAEKATITFEGRSFHPGYSKGLMVNSLRLASKLIERLPYEKMSPETTSDYEGFIHPYSMSGDVSHTVVKLILRDFELSELEEKKRLVNALCQELQSEEPRAVITAEFESQYKNMRYWLEKDMRPVEYARQALAALQIPIQSKPTRGGTDGSTLTEMGLPTPNLFSGAHQIHGPQEWASLSEMEQAVLLMVEISKAWSDGSAQME